jgi:hypothetical protein
MIQRLMIHSSSSSPIQQMLVQHPACRLHAGERRCFQDV